MTAKTTLSTKPDAREAERPSRAGTYLRLGRLLKRLPAPKSISFSQAHSDSLWIELDSVENFDEWVLLMNARVSSRDKLIEGGGSVQSHASATWEGWAVYLQVVILVPAEDRHADGAHHAAPGWDAACGGMAPIPATLGCPRCSHTVYASEEDPDAGLGQMHNHILWEHADRNADDTIALLSEVTVMTVDGGAE